MGCENRMITLTDLARQSKIITGDTACFDGKIQAGLPFSGYPTGVDINTMGSIGILPTPPSSSGGTAVFSGNTGTTVFDVANPLSVTFNPIFSSYSGASWTNPIFSANTTGLTLPITILSADTQIIGPTGWVSIATGMTGDHIVDTLMSGYTLTYSFIVEGAGGMLPPLFNPTLFSGFCSVVIEGFTAGTLDYKGPVDYLRSREDATVDNRLTTKKLRVTGGASASTIGHVLTQIDELGNAGWQPSSGASADTNTFVTSGALDGSGDLVLTYNTAGTVPPIDLSALSGTSLQSVLDEGTDPLAPPFTSADSVGILSGDSIVIGTGDVFGSPPITGTTLLWLDQSRGRVRVAGYYPDNKFGETLISGENDNGESTIIVSGEEINIGTTGSTIILEADGNILINGLGELTSPTIGDVLSAKDASGRLKWVTLSGASADTNTFVTGGTFPTAVPDTLSLHYNNGGSAADIDLSSLRFSGGVGDCISDLYITNLHGCSPITIHDSLISNTSNIETISALSNNLVFGENHTITGFTLPISIENSVLLGGENNTINPLSQIALRGAIIGGKDNSISGRSENAFIAGSVNSTIQGAYLGPGGAVIGSSNSSIVNSRGTAIVGGSGNSIASGAQYSIVIGGIGNVMGINASKSIILGGEINNISGSTEYSGIFAGSGNTIDTHSNSVIIGGDNNLIHAPLPARQSEGILGGSFNTISGNSSYSTIIGGNLNLISGAFNSSIIGSTECSISGVSGGHLSVIIASTQSWVDNTISNANNSTHISTQRASIKENSDYSIIMANSHGQIIDSSGRCFIIGGHTNPAAKNTIEGVSANAGIIGAGTSNINFRTRNSLILGGSHHTISGDVSVDGNGAIVGGSGNTINSSITRSVVLGGKGITASVNDTVYVPNLNIGTVGVGTSIFNLGIDSGGNIVTGSTGSGTFTGNTSGDCIDELWVSIISGCSPVTIGSSIQSQGSSASTSGSIAYGNKATASGNYSHAEGTDTTASHDNAHAEGRDTLASGYASHAEGQGASATTEGCHAEGGWTLASGDKAHAEGQGTIASGGFSHAEGRDTIADGEYSHAEGISTKSIGAASHTEGTGTSATTTGGHAEGAFTISAGISAHAEGSNTEAIGSQSHAEGQFTQALGSYSHSTGRKTIADGDGSYAGGVGGTDEEVIATGATSFAHFFIQEGTGLGRKGAQGDYSAILGGRDQNITKTATTGSIIIGGQWNEISRSEHSGIISGNHNWITGDTTGTITSNFIGGGVHNIIRGPGLSHAPAFKIQKYNTILGGDNNLISGHTISNSIIGGTFNSIEDGPGGNFKEVGRNVIIGGENNTIDGASLDSVIIGASGLKITDSFSTTHTQNLEIHGQGYSLMYDVPSGYTSTSIVPDFYNGNVQTIILSGGTPMTLENPVDNDNLKVGATYIIVVKQDASTGDGTLSYGTHYLWEQGIPPIITTGTTAVDVLSFVVYNNGVDLPGPTDDGNRLLGNYSQNFS